MCVCVCVLCVCVYVCVCVCVCVCVYVHMCNVYILVQSLDLHPCVLAFNSLIFSVIATYVLLQIHLCQVRYIMVAIATLN